MSAAKPPEKPAKTGKPIAPRTRYKLTLVIASLGLYRQATKPIARVCNVNGTGPIDRLICERVEIKAVPIAI